MGGREKGTNGPVERLSDFPDLSDNLKKPVKETNLISKQAKEVCCKIFLLGPPKSAGTRCSWLKGTSIR